jgi:hypothetical protein
MSWRDSIPVHPAADIFPLLGDGDLLALAEDIKRNGLMSPIAVVVENGKPILIDGRNRLDAMERLGWNFKFVEKLVNWHLLVVENPDGLDVDGYFMELMETSNRQNAVFHVPGDPTEYIANINIHRRHLTTESKRALIAELLKKNPERSDRATAELVKLDHKTVGAVRRHEEDAGNVPTPKRGLTPKAGISPLQSSRRSSLRRPPRCRRQR